jgi:hypothetical protein
VKIPNDTPFVVGPQLTRAVPWAQITDIVRRHRERGRQATTSPGHVDISFTTRTRLLDADGHLVSIFTKTKGLDATRLATVIAFADEWEALTGEPVPAWPEH